MANPKWGTLIFSSYEGLDSASTVYPPKNSGISGIPPKNIWKFSNPKNILILKKWPIKSVQFCDDPKRISTESSYPKYSFFCTPPPPTKKRRWNSIFWNPKNGPRLHIWTYNQSTLWGPISICLSNISIKPSSQYCAWLTKNFELTLCHIETPFNTFVNRADLDQAALVRVWSGFTLFANRNMIRYTLVNLRREVISVFRCTNVKLIIYSEGSEGVLTQYVDLINLYEQLHPLDLKKGFTYRTTQITYIDDRFNFEVAWRLGCKVSGDALWMSNHVGVERLLQIKPWSS